MSNVDKKVFIYPYNDCKQYNITLNRGKYLFELWGAQGGNSGNAKGGKGAYVSGITTLNSKETFYIYIGGQGNKGFISTTRPKGGCNGGGDGGFGYYQFPNGGSGGGATDIRLNDSYESRIIVAAGGGGAGGSNEGGSNTLYGGYGGDIKGGIAGGLTENYKERQIVANQTFGNPEGIGQQGRDGQGNGNHQAEGNGGGGGGYWGGLSIQKFGDYSRSGGGGGSSFIDRRFFSHSTMLNGGKVFDSPNGQKDEGNSGDGFCKITAIIVQTKLYNKRTLNCHFMIISFLITILTSSKKTNIK